MKVRLRMKCVLAVFLFLFLFTSFATGADEDPPIWPNKIYGTGELMIWLHKSIISSSSLESVEVQVKRVSTTPLFTGTTLYYDGSYYQRNPVYGEDSNLPMNDSITLTVSSTVLNNNRQNYVAPLNDWVHQYWGTTGHCYSHPTCTSDGRDFYLGYGKYEIKVIFNYTSGSSTTSEWYVDMVDPYYPYDKGGLNLYYDVCFLVKSTFTAYLSDIRANEHIIGSGDGYVQISEGQTGRLTDAFYKHRSHRTALASPGNFHIASNFPVFDDSETFELASAYYLADTCQVPEDKLATFKKTLDIGSTYQLEFVKRNSEIDDLPNLKIRNDGKLTGNLLNLVYPQYISSDRTVSYSIAGSNYRVYSSGLRYWYALKAGAPQYTYLGYDDEIYLSKSYQWFVLARDGNDCIYTRCIGPDLRVTITANSSNDTLTANPSGGAGGYHGYEWWYHSDKSSVWHYLPLLDGQQVINVNQYGIDNYYYKVKVYDENDNYTWGYYYPPNGGFPD